MAGKIKQRARKRQPYFSHIFQAAWLDLLQQAVAIQVNSLSDWGNAAGPLFPPFTQGNIAPACGPAKGLTGHYYIAYAIESFKVVMDSAVIKSRPKRAAGRRRWMAGAACAVFLGIGVAVGASLSRDSGASHVVDLSLDQSNDWIDDVCANFRVFGRKYQPLVDVGPDDDAAFAELVQRTIGIDMTVPTFEEGASIFEGARVVAIDRAPGIELFYRNAAGDLLSVFVLARPASPDNQVTDVQETIRDDLIVSWWQGERTLVAVVGPSSDANMPELAQAAYLKL